MILIAESGSTKTEWAIIDGNYVIGHEFTEGINPFFQSRREISHSVRLGLPEHFFRKRYETVYFYGAGCTTTDRKEIIRASLVAQFKSPIEVESDLLAAARGLLKNEAGIACILGTGSNSCFYDGKQIIQNVRSLGYILGDEGSGAVMGRIFLADCLKELAPKELMESFYDKFRITADDALESVYSRPFPNRFLSTISFFLNEHLDNDYVYNLVYSNLRNFFIRNIFQYKYKDYPISFVGSVAYVYAKILNSVAKEFDITISNITETPMSGLVEFHTYTYKI
ncbi:MAG: hypothetical protein H6Q12_438 [Bacteroidetes bacterium]|nr:hypothetical protein [Bacteroidota bacterium]